MRERTLIALSLTCLFVFLVLCPASAYEAATLHTGMRGEDVRKMQQALIDQGYLGGTADGVFGTRTENAVRKFQKAHHLVADGLAGAKTLSLLYGKSPASSGGASAPAPSGNSSGNTSQISGTSTGAVTPGTPFGGNYATLRNGDQGDRVLALQKALNTLGYLSGGLDGKYGSKTQGAVYSFQKKSGLSPDGVAGKRTLQALEAALKSGGKAAEPTPEPTAAPTGTSLPADAGKITPPTKSEVKLLHWYNDVKPALRTKSVLLIYEPVSRLAWKLRVYSRGRHCDAEPLTLQDTQIMLKAFGGKNTWNQKGVYVRLPSGVWTVGATHTMPHLTGSIPDNGFDGHLCIHFLRNMAECEEKDPNYGVSNQRTIRTLWKSLTGEDISI